MKEKFVHLCGYTIAITIVLWFTVKWSVMYLFGRLTGEKVYMDLVNVGDDEDHARDSANKIDLLVNRKKG